MVYIRFIIRQCGWRFIAAAIIGMIGGLSLTWIVAIIHKALAESGPKQVGVIMLFILLITVRMVACLYSEYLLIKMSESIAFGLRLKIGTQVLEKPLRIIEEIGNHRIYAILIEDIDKLTNVVRRSAETFINLAIVVGCYGYIYWLSPSVFVLNLLFIVLGFSIYSIPIKLLKNIFLQARYVWDDAILHFRFLTGSVKELKINRAKQRDFLDHHFFKRNNDLKRLNIKSKFLSISTRRFGETLIIVNMGCLLFVFPHFIEISSTVLTGVMLAIIFSLSPLDTTVGNVNSWLETDVSLKKIQSLGFDLFSPIQQQSGSGKLNEFSPRPALPNTLQVRDLTYQYEGNSDLDGHFHVGPVSFSLKSGEINFLTGGNGSGKTTLAKTLCGLYSPQSGSIMLNDKEVSPDNMGTFQQHFSVLFADTSFFRHILGFNNKNVDEQANEYLHRLGLSSKVLVKNATFSTLDLSEGQKKRLSLLLALLEDKPIYIFDECAANQDTSFKQQFYFEILPAMKKQGKLVLVITHDESYFHIADKIIKIEDGTVKMDTE